MKDIYTTFEELGIAYEKYEHPAVFTVEEAEKYDRGDATHSKNLFLRNKKGNKHYLVVVKASKKVNLKELEKKLEEPNLSFASAERLMKYLGVTPGFVSPFGLIHDTNKEVHVVIDEGLLAGDKQGFHPNINTQTLIISTTDFKKFLEYIGNTITHIDL